MASAASDCADGFQPSHHGRLERKTWTFRGKYPIAYEVATNNDDVDAEGHDAEVVPILLLNGFGVGSFHQHPLMREMLRLERSELENKKQRLVIYGIDYLGQGRSWPENCNNGNSEDKLGLVGKQMFKIRTSLTRIWTRPTSNRKCSTNTRRQLR